MVIVKEAGSGRVLCKDAIMCSSFWSQARGLILSRRKNLIFVFPKPTIARLHMVLVLFSIEVIGVLNSGKVACHSRLKPFTFWKSPIPVTYIIEFSKEPYRVPRIGSTLQF